MYRIIESCSRYGLGFDSLVCQSSNMVTYPGIEGVMETKRLSDAVVRIPTSTGYIPSDK
jgi:hypothetical protein